MADLNELSRKLIELRGTESVRKVAKRAGISHNYLGMIEKGFDPQTKAPTSPSPETLMSLAIAYDYSYEELMMLAGYLPKTPDTKKPIRSDLELSDDELISKYNVVLDGKPIEESILREILSYVRVRRSTK